MPPSSSSSPSTIVPSPLPRGLYVFGYGSLIFRPPPRSVFQVAGYLSGFQRRFWQESTDHRGTPDAPGRVVTLVEAPEEEEGDDGRDDSSNRCWGLAFFIEHGAEAEVEALLDVREQGGYSKTRARFYYRQKGGEDVLALEDCLVYVGKRDNPQFRAELEMDQLARLIHRSVGPSGRNKDYLYDLAEALRRLTPESKDEHLDELEARVRQIDQAQ